MKTFSELNIKQEIKDAIIEMGFSEPTPIQGEIIPIILEGKDCLAQAPTGTGKTCAFGVPIVNMVDTKNPSVQAVVLCPTRELAMQTENELKKLAKFMVGVRILAVYGGQPIERQLAGIRKKPQIIVGTPGRIIDHLRRRTLRLQDAKMAVLDEADEMLNMGFRDDIDSILSQMPDERQSMLFSATMPKEILEISMEYQHNPISIKTTISGEDMPPITQYYVKLKETTKYDALLQIIKDKDYKLVLVFTNTKHKAGELDEQLQADNYLSAALHGDLRQKVRDTVMRSYRDRKLNILVATDVAARGIDVENIEAIFNYDVPLDEEYYIHRIGRTARANKTGVAYSFVTARDIHKLNFYEKLTGSPINELRLAGISEDKLNKSRRKEDTGKKFFLNVGAKDELNESKIANFVISKTQIVEDDIEAIKILDIFSFVTVRKEVADEMLTLNGERFANRRLAVETAEELPRGGSERGSRGGSERGSRGGSERSSSRGGSSRGGSERSSRGGSERGSRGGSYSKDDKPRSGSSRGYYSKDEKPRSERTSDNESMSVNYVINEYGTKVATKEYGDRPIKKDSNGNYKPRTEGEYKPRSEGGYKPRTEGGYKPRSEGGYKPKTEGGYKPRTEGGYKPKTEGGYKPRTEGEYKPRTEGEYKPRTEGGYKPKTEGGYKPKTEGGYKPRTEGEYKPRSEGGYKPKTEGGKSTTGGAGADYRKFRTGGTAKKKSPTVTFGDNKPTRKNSKPKY
ncbi:MAG TPA: DEAD/DEAH box helicase [Clostridia bacterium]|nr:DEAD/DEAH box helicase [Clostridia bacterium]